MNWRTNTIVKEENQCSSKQRNWMQLCACTRVCGRTIITIVNGGVGSRLPCPLSLSLSPIKSNVLSLKGHSPRQSTHRYLSSCRCSGGCGGRGQPVSTQGLSNRPNGPASVRWHQFILSGQQMIERHIKWHAFSGQDDDVSIRTVEQIGKQNSFVRATVDNRHSAIVTCFFYLRIDCCARRARSHTRIVCVCVCGRNKCATLASGIVSLLLLLFSVRRALQFNWI